MFKSLPAGSNVGDIFKLKPEARRAQGELGRVTPGQWPDALDAMTDRYMGEPFLGPLA